MKSLPLMLLALLCLCLTSCDRTMNDPQPAEEPENIAFSDSLKAFQANSVLPGFAVTIFKNGRVDFQEAFGHADVVNEVKYTNHTIQPIGSVSKTFIGVALMKAIEQEHFTLGTPINDILPFPVINPHQPEQQILIKHLVTHTAGFEDSDENYELEYFIREGENALLPSSQAILDFGVTISNGRTLGDYMQAVFTEDGELYDADNFLEEGAGVEYEYSNICASLAAYLIELKSGDAYADFVKTHIFNPLGMTATGYDRRELAEDRLAKLYIDQEFPLPEYSHSSYPDGFVNTTNDALSKYMLEMMLGARGAGTLLNRDNYRTLFERQSPEGIEENGEVHAVFFFFFYGRIAHNGSDPAVVAFIFFDPLTNSGYQIMVNVNDGGLGEPLGVNGQISFGQFFDLLGRVEAFEQE
ncbi:MAG: serine hydrolase domain-containing protein [Saprospiraceae bacterium]